MALRSIRPVAPRRLRDLFDWDSYRLLDAIIALTPYEASLLTGIHNAPLSRVHVVPNGVEEAFLKSQPASRGPWLVCTGTITKQKEVLKLAPMAVRADAPGESLRQAYHPVGAAPMEEREDNPAPATRRFPVPGPTNHQGPQVSFPLRLVQYPSHRRF